MKYRLKLSVDKIMTIICAVGLILVLSIVLTSCGTTQYNVGTGKAMHKQCQGAWTGGQ